MASTFEALLLAQMNFVMNKPVAVLSQASAQNLTSGAAAAINMDTVVDDTYSGWSAIHPSRYTAQVAGRYLVIGQVTFANVTGGNRILNLYKNGTVVNWTGFDSVPAASAAVFPGVNGAGYVTLAAGDFIEIFGYQDSGSTVATHGGGSSMVVSWDRN